jgi:hypothetical protein
MKALDRLMEKARKQGPCLLCGHGYARHRLWDAIDGALRIDRMDEEQIGRNWPGVTVQEIADVREAYAAARRAKRALPGRSPQAADSTETR